MIDRKNIKVSVKFCTVVLYKKTNRHGTRIFTVSAKAERDDNYIYVGKFHVSAKDEITYIPQPHMFCSLLSKEIQQIYGLSELLKLVQ